MELMNKQIAEYTEEFTSKEPEIVKELLKDSEEELEHIDMTCGRQVGWLLRILVQVSGARRVLEIGTFTGYSAIMMADALNKNDELITCELNQRYHKISEKFFKREPYNQIIKQVSGDAIEIIPGLTGRFDLIFLDADKINYPKYYLLAKEKIRPGGLIVLDNTVWGGEVLDGSSEKARAIHKTNEIIRNDDDAEQVMIPLRDGLTVVRIR